MRAYTVSMRCRRVPHGQNIARGVLVPVVGRTAIASPTAHIKRHRCLQRAARRAQLARRKPAVDFDDGFPVYVGFGLDGPNGNTDSGIAQAAGKAVVFDHVPQCQILDCNRVEAGNEVPRQLVDYVLARVTDLLVHTREPLLAAPPAVASLLLARQVFLNARHAVLVAVQVARVGDSLAIGECCQTADTEVNPNGLPGFRQRRGLHIHDHRDEVAPGWGPNHCHGRWIDWNVPRPLHLEPPQLGDKQPLITDLEPKSRARVFRRLPAFFLFERWVARALIEKVAKGGLQVPQSLLCRHAGDFVQPQIVRVLFEGAQGGARLQVVQTFAALKCRRALRKEAVVHEPHTAKRPRKDSLLLGRWVAAEVPALFHAYILSRLYVSRPCGRPSFPPRPEVRGFSEAS